MSHMCQKKHYLDTRQKGHKYDNNYLRKFLDCLFVENKQSLCEIRKWPCRRHHTHIFVVHSVISFSFGGDFVVGWFFPSFSVVFCFHFSFHSCGLVGSTLAWQARYTMTRTISIIAAPCLAPNGRIKKLGDVDKYSF